MSRRWVVLGAGAVGGVVAARLHEAGGEVAVIARGPHLAAIRRDGLRLLAPGEDATFAIPASDDPAQLEVGRDGDVVLLAVKSQDTVAALDGLRAAGAEAVPVVCLQNGVANEREALRRFADVYGAVVMLPGLHLEPGVVEQWDTPATWIVDVGRYPSGSDALAAELVAALAQARFRSDVLEDIMRAKYSKLLGNLPNAVSALFAAGEDRDVLAGRVTAEGTAVLDAARIDHDDPRIAEITAGWESHGIVGIADRERGGGSTWQSLRRGSARAPASVETDYLNGEISLLGRLHGVATPLNDALCRLSIVHARRGGGPGELAVSELETRLEELA